MPSCRFEGGKLFVGSWDECQVHLRTQFSAIADKWEYRFWGVIDDAGYRSAEEWSVHEFLTKFRHSGRLESYIHESSGLFDAG